MRNLVIFALIMLGVLPLSAQKSRVKESPIIKGKVLPTKCYTFAASEGKFKYSIKVDFPVGGNRHLRQNVQEWIQEYFSPLYDGDVSDIKGMILASYEYEKSECCGDFPCEFSFTFTKECENDKYVTYSFFVDEYGGGAHNITYKHGATFRVTDGRRFGWDMFTNKNRVLNIVKEELKRQYFNVATDTELWTIVDDFRDVVNNRYLPLPRTEPWITEKGVLFYYEEYEIAAYIYRAPFCVVSFDKLKEYMTPAARRLIE
ncbi:MAG: DUF3298 domain-containing protein [Bacteroidaceae bacterium]|nr:DUF3298 domain-containing protein [Bacteroidaceae bacterium]